MIETSGEKNLLGSIKVSAEVIEVIVSFAALEVDGVYGMHKDFLSIFGGNEHTKGVFLKSDEIGTEIDIYCYFDYGVNVPEVAINIQQNVKEQVYHMTEIEIDEVHVHIVGIIPEESAAADIVTASDLELGEEIT